MNELEFNILFIILQFFLGILIFSILGYVTKYIVPKLKNSSLLKNSRIFNLKEYFPDEEIPELMQLFYLAMIVVFSVNMLYILISWGPETINITFIDIIVSLYLAIKIEPNSFKNKLLLFLLIPFGSINFIIFGGMSWIGLIDLVHAPIFLYFIKMYFEKVMKYSETNGFGISIFLLFSIVFISFIVTMIVEKVSPLNSLVMVSNAFTSNGYAVLGSSGWGKINSLFLVWSGFFLSGIATATLTVAIVMKHVNKEFDNLESLVKKNKKN